MVVVNVLLALVTLALVAAMAAVYVNVFRACTWVIRAARKYTSAPETAPSPVSPPR